MQHSAALQCITHTGSCTDISYNGDRMPPKSFRGGAGSATWSLDIKGTVLALKCSSWGTRLIQMSFEDPTNTDVVLWCYRFKHRHRAGYRHDNGQVSCVTTLVGVSCRCWCLREDRLWVLLMIVSLSLLVANQCIYLLFSRLCPRLWSWRLGDIHPLSSAMATLKQTPVFVCDTWLRESHFHTQR